MPGFITPINVTIASGASLSGAAPITGQMLRNIIMPAAWTAAPLTIQASEDGIAWFNLFDENGAEVTIQAAAGVRIRVPYGLVDTMSYLRLRSGTAGTPVAQTATRVLTLISRTHV